MASRVVDQIELLFKNANELYRYNKHSEVIQELSKIESLMTIFPCPYFNKNTANIFNQLARFYQLVGKREKAISYYQRTLNIINSVVGKKSENSSYFLMEIGELFKEMGRFDDAIIYLQEALKIRKHLLGMNHPDTAQSLNNLAELYRLIGRYDDALLLQKQSLKIRKNILTINHIHTTQSLNNLALSYYSIGRYEDALPFLQQALEIRKSILGMNHRDTANSLNNLAVLYYSMVRYEEALRLNKEALEIRKNILGMNHRDTANSLNNLAELYRSIGRYDHALLLQQQSLKIRENILGINHIETGTSINNLGLLYQSMGRLEEALPLFQQSLEIRKHILGINHPETASALNNLGLLYKLMGRCEDALPLYEQALEIRKNILGINHPETANSLNNLGNFYESMGKYEDSYTLMLQAVDIQLKLMLQIFKVSNKQQNLTLLQRNYYHFDVFISLVFQSFSHSSQAVQSVFEVIQKIKLIVTETTILQKNALLSLTDTHLKTLFNKHQELTQTIINLTFQTLTKEQKNYRNQLIEEQQKLEAELSRQIPELDLERKLLEIDRRAVALEIPENSTLLEFVRLNVYDFTAIPANGESQWKPARYLAFILSAGQPDNIQMIDLGEAENIDRLIKVFRENIRPEKSQQSNTIPKKSNGGLRICDDYEEINTDQLDKLLSQNLQQLQQLLFNPIKPHLPANTKKLIIAADGQLNLLPFEVIPINENQYLMDEYTITYLNVGRDLIRLKFPSTTQPTAPLIIANPDYNLSDETTIASQDTPTQTQVNVDIPDSDLRKSQPGGKFAPIPGTALEALQVSQYLGVTPQTEKNALESLVKSQLSPRILHIATHGYFLPVDKLQEKFKESSIKLESLNLTISTLDHFHQAGMQNIQNPLLRAGLAFAGANTALNGGKLPPAAEDGILTAQDVATLLDLRGTELVVLSSCESGLGDVNLGESVQGLRHAFIQAGAKSLIVSLWAVSDIATAILMGRFYHYYLEDKLPVSKALEQAKIYVCNLTVGQMRDTWLTKEKIEYVGRYSPGEEDKLRILANDDNDYQPYKHPKYWAAFICLGLAD